tara:strand:+ start:14775 stop:14972 length:198 start_codon:yes stop_codon:yes gene_type:complete
MTAPLTIEKDKVIVAQLKSSELLDWGEAYGEMVEHAVRLECRLRISQKAVTRLKNQIKTLYDTTN